MTEIGKFERAEMLIQLPANEQVNLEITQNVEEVKKEWMSQKLYCAVEPVVILWS